MNNTKNPMNAHRLAELYDLAEAWRRDWQRDPRQGVNGQEAALTLLEALAEISRMAGPYLPAPADVPPRLPTSEQLRHGAVALEIAAEDAGDPARKDALEAVAGWVKELYLRGGG